MTDFKLRADKAMATLKDKGLKAEVLERLSGFVIFYGLFENQLESGIWAVRNEEVAGKRPSTDAKPIKDWLKEFDKNNARFSDEAFAVVKDAIAIIENISDYRHGIIHGAIILFSGFTTFVRNPRWGDIQRSRPTTDSHIDENLLNLALDCVLTLLEFGNILNKFKNAHSIDDDLLRIEADISRCSSSANELRHLTDLMNHEKY